MSKLYLKYSKIYYIQSDSGIHRASNLLITHFTVAFLHVFIIRLLR